ncbi:MAG: PhnD/SsuA/transferrin family substrate-binding protein [Ignavibacteria bacterium]|nr:PhnD/SsuA/transferrin family substrate-binding protein [Ignavibacteria bacterium]
MKLLILKYFLVLLIFSIAKDELLCQNKYPEEINFKMGLMAYAFDEVNLSDGNAALEMWMESTKKRLVTRGVKKLDIVYKNYNNLEKLEDDVISGKVDVFSIKTTDFYKLKNFNNYQPLIVGSRNANSIYEQFILITNKQTGYKNINDIVSEEIVTAKTVFEDLSQIWAEVVIKENSVNKLKKRINFNSQSITEYNLILGVFFGKYKCAVVSLSVFELVCELNPKVKSNTVILSTSPELINVFFARKKNIPEATIEALEIFAEELNDDKEGKQILSLFKTVKVEKLSTNEIFSTKELIQKHKRLFNTK